MNEIMYIPLCLAIILAFVAIFFTTKESFFYDICLRAIGILISAQVVIWIISAIKYIWTRV